MVVLSMSPGGDGLEPISRAKLSKPIFPKQNIMDPKCNEAEEINREPVFQITYQQFPNRLATSVLHICHFSIGIHRTILKPI